MTVHVDDSAAPHAPGDAPVAARVPRSHRDYSAWRARQIAYGRWSPWVDAEPVREHVRCLRQRGTSYRTIARAARVSVATVWSLLHGQPSKACAAPKRMRAAQARRLLAVTADGIGEGRRSSAGSRRRLQALVAMGYLPAELARQLGVPPGRVWRVIGSELHTVSPGMHAGICDLYERMWDRRPPERTPQERAAASAARRRAARAGWPPPMALDDDRLDDPSYRPRARWRPASGTGPASPSRRRADSPPGGPATSAPRPGSPARIQEGQEWVG
jgi:hypothetical protein